MKRLVICFDGTWNNADSDKADTNVALIARAIHATQDTGGVPQSVLYLRGVGATGLEVQRVVEGATGLGIDDNIRSGYMFLAQNYLPGDDIFLFGFSRGAFTARSLAGFIGACGLLKRQRLGDLGKAWNYYRQDTPNRSPANFLAACQTDCHAGVTVTFLGVWDTVGALGIPGHALGSIVNKQYEFHDTTPSRIVKHGCHALAIDEERDEFVPTLWTGKVPDGCAIDQVWFAGVHSDVGGGYVDRTLADIPLVWMAQQAEKAGLSFDWSCLPDLKTLNPLASRHDSRQGWSEKDRLTPTFREVCQTPFQVSFYETLYRPLDENGHPLPTINEAVHQSVVTRFGQQGQLSTDDTKRAFEAETYKPRNLSELFKDGSRPACPIAQ